MSFELNLVLFYQVSRVNSMSIKKTQAVKIILYSMWISEEKLKTYLNCYTETVSTFNFSHKKVLFWFHGNKTNPNKMNHLAIQCLGHSGLPIGKIPARSRPNVTQYCSSDKNQIQGIRSLWLPLISTVFKWYTHTVLWMKKIRYFGNITELFVFVSEW